MRGLLAALLVLLGAALLPLSAAAQEGVIDDDAVNAVARQLYCPDCEAPLTVDVCGSVTCAAWRAEIRARLQEGEDAAAILEDFAARYGQHVLVTPPAEGFGMVIWLAPVATSLIGAALLLAALIRLAPAQRPGPFVDYGDLPEDYLIRLEREIAEFRGDGEAWN
ncbi:MAG: hypothetical protein Kow00124_14020 [Anaerolineae bacterium]